MGHEAILVTQDNSDCLPWNRGVKVTPLNKFKLNGNYDLVFATLWATVPLLEKIRSKRKLYLIQMDERNFYDKATDIKKVEETYKIKEIEFVTMARWIQDWLLDEFGRDSFYIPNGIDLSLFKPVEPRLSRVRRFLIEGKINVPAKGVAEAYKVIEKMPCERWIVSGDGEKPRDWNINKFFLRVNQRRMVQIYQKCDVLLKMSRVESFEFHPWK
jgi:glycosyltransferase involved in cell wall biosynthesis